MNVDSRIDVRRAADRFHTDIGWLDSKHSFSFGSHYSPDNTNHGQLLVLNDDRVAPAGGFGAHPHKDMEIVTWVLSGELEHRDSEGNHGVIYPGLAQRMSAGRGIRHSEMNASSTDEVHFIQMWVVPDTASIDPGYEQADINEALAGGGLVPVASGQGHEGAVSIHQKDAVLWAARLGVGDEVVVPEAPYVHVFVATGDVTMDAVGPLQAGDAVRLTGHGGMAVTADSKAEVLIWTTGELAVANR